MNESKLEFLEVEGVGVNPGVQHVTFQSHEGIISAVN